MHSRPLRLALRLGLFQISLGILGVLILGLLNRLLIQDIQVPAVLAALALLVILWASNGSPSPCCGLPLVCLACHWGCG